MIGRCCSDLFFTFVIFIYWLLQLLVEIDRPIHWSLCWEMIAHHEDELFFSHSFINTLTPSFWTLLIGQITQIGQWIPPSGRMGAWAHTGQGWFSVCCLLLFTASCSLGVSHRPSSLSARYLCLPGLQHVGSIKGNDVVHLWLLVQCWWGLLAQHITMTTTVLRRPTGQLLWETNDGANMREEKE